jgi:hypothetical protein
MKIGELEVHESVTEERIMELHERRETTLDDPGVCIVCGAEAHGVEPDARRYRCESCGCKGVWGPHELLMRIA